MKKLNFKFYLNDSIEQIRTRLIYAILFILCALGTPTIIIASVEAYNLKQYNSIIVYLLFLIPIIIITIFRKKLSYRFISIAAISLGQIIAISNLVIYSTGGAGIEIFFTLFVLTTIFFNLKSGLYMILISGIATSIVGYLYTHNYLILKLSLDEIATKPISWITALSVLVFLGIFIVFSYGFIQSKMLHSIQQALQNSDNLKKTNLQLINDANQKKQAEIELKKSEEQFRTIIEQAGDAMYLYDFVGNILMVNNSSSQSLGYSKEEFLKMNISDLDPYYVDLNKSKKLWEPLEPGKIQAIESFHKRKDGSIFPVEIRFSLYNIEDNKSILGFARDITKYKESEIKNQKLNEELELRVVKRTKEIEHKNIELANAKIALLNIVEDLNEKSVLLEDSTQNLKKSNKELEAFSYSVSHDLKTPLRAITGFSQILNEDYGTEFSAETKRYLGIITDSAENMGVLINDLLSFSRMGRKALRISQVNIHDIVFRIKNELKSEIQDRKLTFKILPMPLVNADESLMYHVMINLISNALKFTGKAEKAKIEIGCESKDKKNVYYIKDNGVGFDMKYADKIFDVFQRLHSNDKYPGTGIGLSIVQRIIYKHNGQIWVQSEKNKGTTFFFTI